MNTGSRSGLAYRRAPYTTNGAHACSDTSVRESPEVNHIRQQLIKIKLDTNNELLKLVLV